jgi:hypothetical protein
MTTDRDIHEQLARTLRTRADLVADAPPLSASGRARIRRTRSRRLSALTAIAVLGFGVAAFAAVRPATNNDNVTTSPTLQTTPSPTSKPLGTDVAPVTTDSALSHDPHSPHSAQQLQAWLQDYDPAEIAWLMDNKDANFGPVTDQLQVTTLEFRRSCRRLQQAEDAFKAGGDPSAVDSIMATQIARQLERDGESSGASMFSDLAAQLKTGDTAAIDQFISGNCGTSLAFKDP